MLASPAMEMQSEAPLALQRLWNLTRARLAGTSTALDEEPAFGESMSPAQVKTMPFKFATFKFLYEL